MAWFVSSYNWHCLFVARNRPFDSFVHRSDTILNKWKFPFDVNKMLYVLCRPTDKILSMLFFFLFLSHSWNFLTHCVLHIWLQWLFRFVCGLPFQRFLIAVRLLQGRLWFAIIYTSWILVMLETNIKIEKIESKNYSATNTSQNDYCGKWQ